MEKDVIKERLIEVNQHNLVTLSSTEQTSTEFANDEEKKETGKCSHFSIRAYVAEIRKKDWKISWPFSSVSDNIESEEQANMLPPFSVPDFRWWGCQNCLLRSGASDVAVEIRAVMNSSEEKVCEGRHTSVNTSVDVIGYECCATAHQHIREKVADGLSNDREDDLTSGNLNNGAARKEDQILKEPFSCEKKDAQCLNEERLTRDAETMNLNSKVVGLVDLIKPKCVSSDVDEVGSGVRNPKCEISAGEIYQKGKLVSGVSEVPKMSEQQNKLVMHHQNSGLNRVSDSLLCHSSKFCSSIFDENDEKNKVSNFHNQHLVNQQVDSSQTLNCSKPQKVRLLADIMKREIWGSSTMIPGFNGITNMGSVNTEVIQTQAIDESDSLSVDILLRSRLPVEESFGRDMGKGKKRKVLQVEGRGPLKMRWSKGAFDNVQICEGDKEDKCNKSVIADSKSINDPSARVDFPCGFESHSNKNMPIGKGIRYKKKVSKPQFEDGQHSLNRWRESLSREPQLMNRGVDSKEIGTETLQLKMADASTEGGFHCSEHNLAVQEFDKRSILLMNDSKILEDPRKYLISIQKDNQTKDLIVKSDAEPSQIGAVNSPFGSASDHLSGVDIHRDAYSNKITHGEALVSEMQTNICAFEGYGSCQRDTSSNHTTLTFLKNKIDMPKLEGGIASFVPHHDGICKEDPIPNKVLEIKPAEAASTSLTCHDAFSRSITNCGLQSKRLILGKASMIMDQNISQAQEKASPLGPKEFPFMNNYGSNTDVQWHSDVLKTQSGERENEVDDDLPMEIVELLAKNRHERRLLEAEKADQSECSMSEMTMNVRAAATMKLTGILQDEMKYLQEKNSQMQKSQSNSGRGCIFATGRSATVNAIPTVRLVGEKSVRCRSFLKQARKGNDSNTTHLEESHDSRGFSVLPISQGNCSSEKQVAQPGSTGNFGIQSCRENGGKLEHSFPVTCLQCSAACLKCSCSTQFREADHVCFFDVANGPSGIGCSQRFATLSQRENRNLDLDFEIFKKINLEQPCACTQKKFGNCLKLDCSSDLCTNKTISAMQLLRLMDLGISSSKSLNIDENRESIKQLSFPQNCKDRSPLNDGIFKIKDTSQRSVPAYSGKNPYARKSELHFPSSPISDAVSLLVQGGKSGMSCSCRTWKNAKLKGAFSPIGATDCKLHGPASGSGISSRNHESFPNSGLQKGFHSAKSSLGFCWKSHLIEDSTINAEVNNRDKGVWPVQGNFRTEICSINRNPADFSTPGSGSEFMREGRDLKCKKMISKRGRPRLRMMKLEALKEPAKITSS